MNAPQRKSFPVTVTRLPTVRCTVCRQTIAPRVGSTAAEALTDHYRRSHPEILGERRS